MHHEPADARCTSDTPASGTPPVPMKRVLLADDEEAIRTLLSLVLESVGFDVLVASDGAQAVEVAATHEPDLILLDMMMPVLDGIDAVAKLRELPQLRDIPIVMLTARTSDSDMIKGWSAGVDYYMTKPFDVHELLRFLDYLAADRAARLADAS